MLIEWSFLHRIAIIHYSFAIVIDELSIKQCLPYITSTHLCNEHMFMFSHVCHDNQLKLKMNGCWSLQSAVPYSFCDRSLWNLGWNNFSSLRLGVEGIESESQWSPLLVTHFYHTAIIYIATRYVTCISLVIFLFTVLVPFIKNWT